MRKKYIILFLVIFLFGIKGSTKEYIAYGEKDKIVIVDFKGKIIKQIKLPQKIGTGGFKIEKDEICFIGEDKRIYWYDLKKRKIKESISGPFFAKSKVLKNLGLYPDGKNILWKWEGEKLSLWDCKKIKGKRYVLLRSVSNKVMYKKEESEKWKRYRECDSPIVYVDILIKDGKIIKRWLLGIAEYLDDVKILDEDKLIYTELDSLSIYDLNDNKFYDIGSGCKDLFIKPCPKKIVSFFIEVIREEKIYLSYNSDDRFLKIISMKKEDLLKKRWKTKHFYYSEDTKWIGQRAIFDIKKNYILFGDNQNRIGIYDIKTGKEWYIGTSESNAQFYEEDN